VPPADAVSALWRIEQDTPALPDAARQFAERLALGTIEHLASIDPLIEQYAEHWRLDRMAAVDRLILRLGVYEFLYCPETPRTVAIDEALELARTYSEQDAVRFVNGVLDGIHHALATGAAGPAAGSES